MQAQFSARLVLCSPVVQDEPIFSRAAGVRDDDEKARSRRGPVACDVSVHRRDSRQGCLDTPLHLPIEDSASYFAKC